MAFNNLAFEMSKKDAWVLIFNKERANEGIYTIQGLQSNSVLTFECFKDARELFLCVKGLATPMLWNAKRISHFCKMSGYNVLLIPTDQLVAPPEDNEVVFSDTRTQLENLFLQTPDNCTDEDCRAP